MKGLNKVTLIGNLGRDPEIRHTHNGDKVANFSVACSETWKDKQTGEQKEKTEWLNIVIFGPLTEIAERYLKKGSRCYLEGSIQTRKWQDQSGNERTSTEVVLKPFRGELLLLDNKDQSSAPREQARATTQTSAATSRRDFDDSIPF